MVLPQKWMHNEEWNGIDQQIARVVRAPTFSPTMQFAFPVSAQRTNMKKLLYRTLILVISGQICTNQSILVFNYKLAPIKNGTICGWTPVKDKSIYVKIITNMLFNGAKSFQTLYSHTIKCFIVNIMLKESSSKIITIFV